MKIFLICPVRNVDFDVQRRIESYVGTLERKGNHVHWPARDTKQDDPTGGFAICKTNFRAILDADEIHVWYDESSAGSKFDMGGIFMLVEMLKEPIKVVIVNDGEVVDNAKKSFYKVMLRLAKKTK